ncbi:MAG: hypothetical protein ACM3RX_01505 [Methanococcaceae archaeon]
MSFGWHAASDEEWKTLELFLGMPASELDISNVFRGTDQGTQLKSTTGWSSGGNGTNSSYFSDCQVAREIMIMGHFLLWEIMDYSGQGQAPLMIILEEYWDSRPGRSEEEIIILIMASRYDACIKPVLHKNEWKSFSMTPE